MHVEGTATGVRRMKVNLPCLTHAVGLYEVPFIMNMESMVGGQILEIGDEGCDVDNGHADVLPD